MATPCEEGVGGDEGGEGGWVETREEGVVVGGWLGEGEEAEKV
jgi:hypothetical protein